MENTIIIKAYMRGNENKIKCVWKEDTEKEDTKIKGSLKQKNIIKYKINKIWEICPNGLRMIWINLKA